MRAPALPAALLSLLLLGACSSYNVTYDYDVTASYGRYKTFDYYTSKKGTGGTTSLMDKRVRAAVEKELRAKGFSMETKADPDFLVTYYPIVQERKVRSTVHVGWGWGYRPFRGGIGTSSTRVPPPAHSPGWRIPRTPTRWWPRPSPTSWPGSRRSR